MEKIGDWDNHENPHMNDLKKFSSSLTSGLFRIYYECGALVFPATAKS